MSSKMGERKEILPVWFFPFRSPLGSINMITRYTGSVRNTYPGSIVNLVEANQDSH